MVHGQYITIALLQGTRLLLSGSTYHRQSHPLTNARRATGAEKNLSFKDIIL